MSRTFESKPAVRESVPLLVGLMGASGSGKTYSALRLATGIQTVTGGEIFYIDTESRRACHYADKFKFQHIDFKAPFGSLDYLEAIQYCVSKGAGVIVVDSMSHEHEGVGGYLMTHAAEIDRMAGNDYAKAERVKFTAWIKPAQQRRALINGILQLNVNMIFCFRAKEKIKLETGKQPVALGWMPIAGEEFLFEQTTCALLYPGSKGVPTWTPDMPGEKVMFKLPEQFIGMMNDGKPMSEEHGHKLAEWAKGTKPEPMLTQGEIEAQGEIAAKKGMTAYEAWFKGITGKQRIAVKDRHEAWKKIASEVAP